MKTLFCSLLSCVFLFSSLAAKAVSVPKSNDVGVKITIIIELGRKSKGCDGFGFCKFVKVSGDYQAGNGGENTAIGTAWMENGRLKIAFDQSSMTDATYQTHFGSGYLQIEEDYVLPSDVASALGVRGYVVKSGKYAVPQVSGENNSILVNF